MLRGIGTREPERRGHDVERPRPTPLDWVAAATHSRWAALVAAEPQASVIASSSAVPYDRDYRAALAAAIGAAHAAAREATEPFGAGFRVGRTEARVMALAVSDPRHHYIAACPEDWRTFKRTKFVSLVRASEQIIATWLDVDAHEGAVQRQVELFEHLETIAKVGVWEFDPDAGEAYWSDQIYRIYGLERRGPVSFDQAMSCFPEPARLRLISAASLALEAGQEFDLELDFINIKGQQLRVRSLGSRRVRPDGGRNLHGVFQGITEQYRTREALRHAANYDELTGLPNRRHFTEIIGRAVEVARQSGQRLGLAILDVRDLRLVNCEFGHAAGDALLAAAARRISERVRGSDLVGRFKGDEFALLMPDLTSDRDLKARIARYEAAVRFVFDWHGASLPVNARIGFAVWPDDATTADDLLKAADLVQGVNKLDQSERVRRYHTSLGAALTDRSQLLASARAAAEAGGFVPFYQPQYDVHTGLVVGLEVLARWRGDDGSIRAASDFMPALADFETGPMIGRAVLRHAIPEIRRLTESLRRPLRVAINASPSELATETTKSWRHFYPGSSKLDIRPLVIEITEDVFLGEPNPMLHDYMRSMVDRGVEFALDDFGTGYASLIHISMLPIHEIKVDRQFVRNIDTDRAAQGMLSGIVTIARAMNLRIVVEGVERVEQEAVLKSLGCRYCQGHLYSPALPMPDVARLLGQT